MSAPPVDNQTDFIVHPEVLVDRDGEKLCAMVKATFELPAVPARGARSTSRDGPFEIAPKARRRGLRPADVPWGDPAVSSIRYPADFCLRKPGTDVVVVATAYAPEGKAVPRFDVGVRAGPLSKVLRVCGLRVWEAGGRGLSAPRNLTQLEMRYDFAFGGCDATDLERIVEHPHNPVGRGIASDVASLTHKPGPQIEDPGFPIENVSHRHPPAGICAIGRHWEPRRGLWGTYDARWVEERAPLLPADFDDRANLCASPGLSSRTPFRGGEEVSLSNLHRGGGGLSFTLPRVGVEITFRDKPLARAEAPVRPALDTVLVDTMPVKGGPVATLELVWRAAIPAPRRLADCEIVVRERST